jgi:hypothetical protein
LLQLEFCSRAVYKYFNVPAEVHQSLLVIDPLDIIEGDQALGPNTFSSLAVSPFSDDVAFLQQKFEEANWKLYVAHRVRGALMQLRRVRASIVICERQLSVDRPHLIVVSLKLMTDFVRRSSTRVLLI